MWLVRKYTGICSQTSLQPAGDGSVRYWASSLQVILIQERPDCLKHSDIQWLQQGDVASEAYFSYRKYDILATVMTQKPVLLLGSEEFTFMFLNRNGSALSCFSELHSYKTPYLFSTNFFFFSLWIPAFPAETQTKLYQIIARAVWLALLSYLPWVFKSTHGCADHRLKTCFSWKFCFNSKYHFIQNIIFFSCSSSFQGVFFRAAPLQRSSHPTAMMLPLFLVEFLKPSLLPAAFMRPGTGFTPGFPLRRPLYCCQMILTVYAAGDSLSLWNEWFYCCQLVREISLKAEPGSSPGSDRFKVEASHHWAKLNRGMDQLHKMNAGL